jgi:hypothetical protein
VIEGLEGDLLEVEVDARPDFLIALVALHCVPPFIFLDVLSVSAGGGTIGQTPYSLGMFDPFSAAMCLTATFQAEPFKNSVEFEIIEDFRTAARGP